MVKKGQIITHHTTMCYLKYFPLYFWFSFFLLTAFLQKSKCVFQLIGPLFRDLVLSVL